MQNADDNVLTAEFKTTGKTADVFQQLKDLKLDSARVLLVADKTPELLRATNNLSNVKLVRPTYLTVFDILNADKVVFTGAALTASEAWLLDKEVQNA